MAHLEVSWRVTGARREGRRLGRVPARLRRQDGVTGYKVRRETDGYLEIVVKTFHWPEVERELRTAENGPG